MKLSIRAFALWLVLGGLTWLYATTGSDVLTLPLAFGGGSLHPMPGSWLTVVLLTALVPVFGVWLTVATVPVLPQRWPGRLGFWMITVPAWLALLVVMQGRAESHPGERMALALAAALAGLGTLWVPFKLRPFPAWQVIREIALVVAFLATAGAVWLCTYDATTRSIATPAEARWAEIGLPLAEFEKTLVPAQENAGSEIVRQVLRKEVSSHFYKDGTRAADREPMIERSAATVEILHKAAAIASLHLPPSDDVDLSAHLVAAIEPLAASLDEDYRHLLAAKPATWASNPHDGYFIDVPNFLGIRTFAQVAAADAMRRLSLGDQDGAARALSAELRLSAGLRQNPTLVSLMIEVSVEALVASKEVRLPPSEGGLQAIATDVVDLRAEFVKRLQLEGWLCLRFAGEINDQQFDSYLNGSILPKWVRWIEGQTWGRRQLIAAALNGAEHAAIQKDPATAALPDLGVSRHNAVSTAFPSTMEFNGSRAAMRMYATLLLREQSELIRMARARLAAGAPIESYDSAVVRGARWELSANAEQATVSTRLVGAPEWILKNEVTAADFWCLPLDGSVAWQFHRPIHTAGGY